MNKINLTTEEAKNKIILIFILIVCIIIISVFIYIDYNNFFSKIGWNIENLNWNLINIIFSAFITIILYFTTYFLVERKMNKRKNNQEQIIKYMLKRDYESCLKHIDIFSKKDTFSLINKNINGDCILYKNETFLNYIKIPFQNDEAILNYALQGVISRELLEKYCYIKKNYEDLIVGLINFNDLQEIKNLLFEGKDNLVEIIKNEIKNINI